MEIYTVALVADGLGLPATLLIFVLTIIIGGRLVKQEGVATLHNMVTKLQKGAAIDQDFAEGALLLIAGFLFIFPGFISDVLGLLLLLPPRPTVGGQPPVCLVAAQVRPSPRRPLQPWVHNY
ncbi:MAG: FxsA family protein [Magnetococcus sp. YQC-3]